VAQVEAQLQRAMILEKGGALGHVDVLRLTSARDSARQGMLRAQTGTTVARAALVLALDLPAGTPLEPIDDFPDPPPAPTTTERQVIEQAVRQRPELLAAAERAEQATAGRAVAKAALLPNVLAIATYQHTEGQSTFQPKNAWFVGATLNWDIWDWGKNWNGVREAGARARQAVVGAETLRAQVVFEAQRRLLEARTAYETLAVGRSALQAAEEAYRIQSIRYAEGAATTTDVIDAETDVSRARSSYAQSRYEYYLAQAAVARAVGNLPVSGSGGSDARKAAR
jgi:outer membrane protein TolC